MGTMPMAGLPDSNSMVWVVPPLLARAPAPVNLFEADLVLNHCVEASTSLGSLIQATAGITGGTGGLRTNRSGWAA